MSLFKTVDATSVFKKTDTEHRLGVTRSSGCLRPNNLLKETIEKNGGQIRVHILQENVGKEFNKGDMFIEIVPEKGLQPRQYKDKEMQFQSRAASELFIESLGKEYKSLNCLVALEPVTLESMKLYAIITKSAIIRE